MKPSSPSRPRAGASSSVFFLLHYYCCYHVNVRSTLRHLRMHNMVAIGLMQKLSHITETLYSLVITFLASCSHTHQASPFYSDRMCLDTQISYGREILTLSFWAWLFSLSIASSRFIHVVTNDRTSVFLKAGQSIASHFLLFPHPLADSWIVWWIVL